MIPREPEQGEGLWETKLLVKQHRWLKYLPTLANTNIYAGSRSQGRFFLPDVLNVSLSVQSWERPLPSLAGSFSRPLDALTYLANLAVNGFFSADFPDFPAFPDTSGQRGRTKVFYFNSSNPTIVTHWQLSLPERMVWGPPCPLEVLSVLVGREDMEQGQTSMEVQDLVKTPRLMCDGCSPFLGTFQRLE